MSRAARRAEISRFKREATRGTVSSFLVEPTDERLLGEPVLQNAIRGWIAALPERKPRCFVCRKVFVTDSAASAFLLAVPSSAPMSCTISAACARCWGDLSDEEIERAAARALRPVLPNGLDDP